MLLQYESGFIVEWIKHSNEQLSKKTDFVLEKMDNFISMSNLLSGHKIVIM
jgi:hypothetical protein